jgi:hypothetical protein
MRMKFSVEIDQKHTYIFYTEHFLLHVNIYKQCGKFIVFGICTSGNSYIENGHYIVELLIYSSY